ncbi:SCO7613 C-terminal domain-containing membrane protein [Agromyces sp. NPDC058484]|uniref:SCO7613 C-terminal domain-containing membrane protein n=1 Tax=Agromyces sp. NPDC058484 TaxID=3346524 RepID=UPI0036543C86
MTLPTISAAREWSDAAVAYLLDATACPVCARDRLRDGRCPTCGAAVGGELGPALAAASEQAAAAIRGRQAVIDRIPVLVAVGAEVEAVDAAGAAPASAGFEAGPATSAPIAPPPVADAPRLAPATARPESSATVQSVLAVAGAGLLAVAAVVFTYFNPDLTDHGLRSVIIAAIALVFLGGAWWLARRGLRFSAESVGGLALVFGALDVAAVVELATDPASAWLAAAVATFVGGLAMVVLALVARIRIWLWAALVALATVPAMFGYAGEAVGAALAGHLAAAFAAFGLIALARPVAPRFGGRLVAEERTLTFVQITAVTLAIVLLPFVEAGSTAAHWLTVAGVLAAVSVLGVLSSRHPARGFWSALAGFAGVAAVAVVPFSTGLGGETAGFWAIAVLVAGASIGLIAAWALTPRLSGVASPAFGGGAVGAVAASAIVPVYTGMATVFATLVATIVPMPYSAPLTAAGDIVAVASACAASAIGFASIAMIAARRRRTAVVESDAALRDAADGALATTATLLAMLAWLLLACLPEFPLGARIAITLALGLVAAAVVRFVAGVRPSTLVGGSLVGGAHGAILLGALLASTDAATQPWAGLAVLIALTALALVLPAKLRFLFVGVGFAYALTVVARMLGTTVLGGFAQWCLTTAAGLLVAIVATFLPRVGPRSWWAILAVAAVPFGIGIVQVVFERSGWTALSTGLMLLLAGSLVLTRRPGLGVALRTAAAALIVPSAAVFVVCLGAQVLAGSASPVVLPVIAAVVAGVLPASAAIGRALQRQELGAAAFRAARIAIEWSALGTGAIAVLLSLVRSAAGLETTLVVLVVLGLGTTAMAVVQRRRLGWWLAAACFTGALWSTWGLVGVTEVEAYLVPPGLVAALVGAVLTARGARGVVLVASGLLVAVLPTLLMLGVALLSLAEGDGADLAADLRGWALVGAAWLLVAVGLVIGRGRSTWVAKLRTLRMVVFATAIVAAAGGALQGARLGVDGMPASLLAGIPLVLVCAGVGLIGGAAAAMAGRGIVTGAEAGSALARSRWLTAPALVYVAFAAWPAIRPEWLEIWSMWALVLALLVIMLIAAVRSVTARTNLPPVWFAFAIAFVTAVVAWSPRELRVEWFSVPLGVCLLAAGVVALRRGGESSPDSAAGPVGSSAGRLSAWPGGGWQGSWALLSPGLAVLLSASIAATFTDPQTWRAILVMVFALTAILVGSSLKLAAPFVIGIIVLPIENVVVFAVQIGRGIESMPWWITLAVVGAVLLIIAVTTERRAGGDQGIAARLGDLR